MFAKLEDFSLIFEGVLRCPSNSFSHRLKKKNSIRPVSSILPGPVVVCQMNCLSLPEAKSLQTRTIRCRGFAFEKTLELWDLQILKVFVNGGQNLINITAWAKWGPQHYWFLWCCSQECSTTKQCVDVQLHQKISWILRVVSDQSCGCLSAWGVQDPGALHPVNMRENQIHTKIVSDTTTTTTTTMTTTTAT